jgi:hypothetical protein
MVAYSIPRIGSLQKYLTYPSLFSFYTFTNYGVL